MKRFIFIIFCFGLFSCDNSPNKRVSNLAVVKITDSNERSQEYIIKYDSLIFKTASDYNNSGFVSSYLHKVEFDEDDAGKIILTLRKGYSLSLLPILTLGDVQENEARIRLQQKYDFEALATETPMPEITPTN